MAEPTKRPVSDAEFDELLNKVTKNKLKTTADTNPLLKPLPQPSKATKLAAPPLVPSSRYEPKPKLAGVPTAYPVPPARDLVKGANLDQDNSKLRALGTPVTTAGKPAGGVANLAHGVDLKNLRERIPDELQAKPSIGEQFRLQARQSPENREGLVGVATSLAPQIKAESDEMGFKRPVVEGALPYAFRLLNLPSATIGATAETAYETLSGSGEKQPEGDLLTNVKASPKEFMSNLSKYVGKGQGVAEVYEKGAKLGEDAFERATGVRPEYKPFGNNWGPDIGFDLSNMAWWHGLGADILTPSAPEAVYLGGRGISKALTRAPGVPPGSATPSELPKLDRSVEDNYERAIELKRLRGTPEYQKASEAVEKTQKLYSDLQTEASRNPYLRADIQNRISQIGILDRETKVPVPKTPPEAMAILEAPLVGGLPINPDRLTRENLPGILEALEREISNPARRDSFSQSEAGNLRRLLYTLEEHGHTWLDDIEAQRAYRAAIAQRQLLQDEIVDLRQRHNYYDSQLPIAKDNLTAAQQRVSELEAAKPVEPVDHGLPNRQDLGERYYPIKASIDERIRQLTEKANAKDVLPSEKQSALAARKKFNVLATRIREINELAETFNVTNQDVRNWSFITDDGKYTNEKLSKAEGIAKARELFEWVNKELIEKNLATPEDLPYLRRVTQENPAVSVAIGSEGFIEKPQLGRVRVIRGDVTPELKDEGDISDWMLEEMQRSGTTKALYYPVDGSTHGVVFELQNGRAVPTTAVANVQNYSADSLKAAAEARIAAVGELNEARSRRNSVAEHAVPALKANQEQLAKYPEPPKSVDPAAAREILEDHESLVLSNRGEIAYLEQQIAERSQQMGLLDEAVKVPVFRTPADVMAVVESRMPGHVLTAQNLPGLLHRIEADMHLPGLPQEDVTQLHQLLIALEEHGDDIVADQAAMARYQDALVQRQNLQEIIDENKVQLNALTQQIAASQRGTDLVRDALKRYADYQALKREESFIRAALSKVDADITSAQLEVDAADKAIEDLINGLPEDVAVRTEAAKVEAARTYTGEVLALPNSEFTTEIHSDQIDEVLKQYEVDPRGLGPNLLGRLLNPKSLVGPIDPNLTEIERKAVASAKWNGLIEKYLGDYTQRISGIPSRWAYHARKGPRGRTEVDPGQVNAAFSEHIQALLKNHPDDDVLTSMKMNAIDEFLEINERHGTLGQELISRFAAPSFREGLEVLLDAGLIDISSIANQVPLELIEKIYRAIQDDLPQSRKLLAEILEIDAEKAAALIMPSKADFLVGMYYRTGVDAAASDTLRRMAEIGYGEFLTPKEIDQLGVMPDELDKLVFEHINTDPSGPPDWGYSDFISAVYNHPSRAELRESQSESQFLEEMITNKVGFGLVNAARMQQKKLDLATIVARMGSPRMKDRLAHAISSDPQLSRLTADIPKEQREQRTRYLVENIQKFITSKDPDQNKLGAQVVRVLSDKLHEFSSIGKNAALGGTFVPNPAYHFANVATAPLIIYQQLGMKAALEATAPHNLGQAAKLVANIYSSDPSQVLSRIEVPKSVDPRGYLEGRDLIKLFQEANLGNSQARFELSRDMIGDMKNYLNKPTIVSRRWDPRFWKNDTWKNIIGAQGSNFWNELGNASDSMWRMSVLIQSLKQGDTPIVATRKAKEALFNYQNLTPVEREAFARYVWFYSFWRHNLVNTFQQMMTPMGMTRIKNQLMLTKTRPESEQEYSTGKPYLGKSVNGRYDLFGPGIPQAEAVEQIAGGLANLYWLSPHVAGGLPGGGVPERPIQGTSEFITKKLSSNKLIDLATQVIANYDLGKRRYTTQYMDPAHAELFKFMGLLDADPFLPKGLVADAFDLTWDDQRKQYKFASPGARNAYILMMKGVVDTVAGRAIRDFGKVIKPPGEGPNAYKNLNLPERLGGLSGIARPYKRTTLDETTGYYNRDLGAE